MLEYLKSVAAMLFGSLREDLLRRLMRNAAVLLTGNVVASLLALAALALTARALGTEPFGTLVLITTFVTTVDSLVSFQTWQAVVKYAAGGELTDANADLKSILKMGYLLDLGTAVAGVAVAVATMLTLGAVLEWHRDHVTLGVLYSLTILFRITGTPAGVLRLFSRFRKIALQNALASFFRLVGVLVVYLSEGGLSDYLLAWAASDIAGRLYLFHAGRQELTGAGIRGLRRASLAGFSDRFIGFWSFIGSTNLHSSVKIIFKEADILLIAAVLGNPSVALYKIVKTIGATLAKLTEPLYQAAYPSMADLVARRRMDDMHSLVYKPVLPVLLVSATGLLGFLLIGQWLIVRVFGAAFADAFVPTAVYMAGTAISMVTFTFHPAMLAFGKATLSLGILAFSTAVYLALLWPLSSMLALTGTASAYVAFYVVWSSIQFHHIRRLLSREPT